MKMEVEIPKRFKKQLKKRFNIKKFTDDYRFYSNSTSCPLCKEFYECKSCLFGKGLSGLIPGCIFWISNILGSNLALQFNIYNIFFYVENRQQATAELKKLNRAAKKYIKWV